MRASAILCVLSAALLASCAGGAKKSLSRDEPAWREISAVRKRASGRVMHR